MENVINAITQLFNILIFGELTPTNETLTINFLTIGNLEISISALTNVLTITLISLATIITIYYLLDILILLVKRFTK